MEGEIMELDLEKGFSVVGDYKCERQLTPPVRIKKDKSNIE